MRNHGASSYGRYDGNDEGEKSTESELIVHKPPQGWIKHGNRVAEQVKLARRELTKTHSVASEAVRKCVSGLYRFQGSGIAP